MDTKKLREQLEIDEGVKYYIYLDSRGYGTCGIGHLIVKGDQEWNKPIKTAVSKARVEALFEHDIKIVVEDCKKLFGGFEKMPDELQQILANMMFNVGLTRLSKFVKFLAAIKAKDLITAAKEMENSNWYKQVGMRAKRLVARMLALAACNVEYSKMS